MRAGRFRDDREDVALAPDRIDVGPVVVGGDEGAGISRLERVAVDVADGWPDQTQDPPRDLAVLLVRGDGDGDVVAAKREVVQRFAVHVHDEAVADAVDRIARRIHQHSRTVDRNVPIRITEHLEDRRRLRRDRAVHLQPLNAHRVILARERR